MISDAQVAEMKACLQEVLHLHTVLHLASHPALESMVQRVRTVLEDLDRTPR